MIARAGIGTLTIVDRDYVEWSNLQRQQLYIEDDAINRIPKAVAAKQHLEKINSEVEVLSYVEDVTSANIEEFAEGVDVIIDATDNFETRLLINDLSIKIIFHGFTVAAWEAMVYRSPLFLVKHRVYIAY